MFDDYFDFVEDLSLLTNLPKDEKFIVLRAAEMTPGFKKIIFIVEPAKTPDGRVMEHLIEVRTRKPGEDHGPFWKTFDTIKNREGLNKIRQTLYKSKGGGYI